MERSDAVIVQRYEYAQKKAKSLNLTIAVCGEMFALARRKQGLGSFCSIDEICAFLCGYEYSVKACDKKEE